MLLHAHLTMQLQLYWTKRMFSSTFSYFMRIRWVLNDHNQLPWLCIFFESDNNFKALFMKQSHSKYNSKWALSEFARNKRSTTKEMVKKTSCECDTVWGIGRICLKKFTKNAKQEFLRKYVINLNLKHFWFFLFSPRNSRHTFLKLFSNFLSFSFSKAPFWLNMLSVSSLSTKFHKRKFYQFHSQRPKCSHKMCPLHFHFLIVIFKDKTQQTINS